MQYQQEQQEQHIRRAQEEDVPRLVALSSAKRTLYQAYQPQFWRRAADADERQEPFLKRLIARENVIALVYEQGDTILGFVIAQLVPAPPVYDPGGLTCSIDDFCVEGDADWPGIGRALLEAAIAEAQAHGAAQTVVVCAHLDEPKRAMLSASGFSIASEWYVKGM
jgi:ribosomal protein S18 acetylase RimI-like enzyme